MAPSPGLGGALIVREMASKGIVPDSKREEALVALGKQQARAKLKQDQKDQEIKDLKKAKNAAIREVREDAEEAEPMHRMAVGGGLTLGLGGGMAAQHYGVDKSKIESKNVKRAILPAVGVAAAVGGMFVPGGAGDFLFGLGLGTAAGSGLTSAVKALAEEPEVQP